MLEAVARGAETAESAARSGRQPSEPDPGHSGEGTATIDFVDGNCHRRFFFFRSIS